MEKTIQKDEIIVDFTKGDSLATLKFLQVGSTLTLISGQYVMVPNGKKDLQLQVETCGVRE
jgi:acyl CoA:acetate/3-ketoacid CoA transferase alpha subunit